MEEYTYALKTKGVNAAGLLVQGATIEMIMEKANKLNADLIIAGRYKHNFIYNVFIGSVSGNIVKNSKIPVLIVPLE